MLKNFCSKRVLSLITAACLLAGMFLSVDVFAASVSWYHLGTNMTFEQLDDEAVVMSVDVEKKKDLCYMLTVSSPKNEDDPYSTSTWTNVMSVMLASDGSVRCFGNGSWLSTENDGSNIGEITADGEVHNLKFKHFGAQKTIEIYIDDIYVHTVDYSARITDEIPPFNMITVSGDSTDSDDSGIEYSLAYIMGTEIEELGVELASYDEASKTVTLRFSEAVVDEISGAVLKPANIAGGEKTYSLTQMTDNSSSIVFECDAEFSSLEEYIIVLPEGLKGKFGSVLKDNKLSYVAEEKSRLVKSSDYTTYDTNVDIKLKTGTEYADRRLNDKDCGAYAVFSWQGAYANGNQHWLGTTNWGETDSREIPTGSKVSEISFDIIPKKADMSFGFSLSHTARNNVIRDFGLEMSFDQAGNIIADIGVVSYGWSTLYASSWSSKVIGTYQKDVPVNIKYVIDKPNKKVYLYLNGKLKKTVDETGENASKLYSAETSYLTLYEMFGHEGTNIYTDRETLFYLDNVSLKVVPDVPYSYVAESDYTTYDTNVDIKLKAGTEYADRRLNDKDCGAYAVFSWQGAYANGNQHWLGTTNWGETDSREIPTGNGVSAISFDIIPKKADMSFGFSLSHTARNNVIRDFGLEMSFDQAGNIIADCGVVSYGWSMLWSQDWSSKVIGTYQKDVPVNIKYVIDKPDKKVYLYLNGELKKTVDETGENASKLYSVGTSYLTLYEMFGHEGTNIYTDRETLFYLDNVKFETEAAAVSRVRFNGKDESKTSAFGTSESVVSSIDVYMNYAVDQTVLDGATALYYDGTEVEYTSEYNADTNCYTITPSSEMTTNGTVTISVAEVITDGAVMPKAYKTYINVDAFTIGAAVEITDAAGERADNIVSGSKYYIDADVTNHGDEPQYARLIVGIFNGDILQRVIMPDVISVEVGNVWSIDKDSENKIEIEVDDDISAIKAFIWETDMITPVCNGAIVTKAN